MPLLPLLTRFKKQLLAVLLLLLCGAALLCLCLGAQRQKGSSSEDLPLSNQVESQDGSSELYQPTEESIVSTQTETNRSWFSERAVADEAQIMLETYQREEICVLSRAGYLDLQGRVWSCLVAGGDWVDLCTVTATDEGGSEVQVMRFDAKEWEEDLL